MFGFLLFAGLATGVVIGIRNKLKVNNGNRIPQEKCMKTLLYGTLLLSLSAYATTYSSNDGRSVPGSSMSKYRKTTIQTEQKLPENSTAQGTGVGNTTTSETGMTNSSGVTTDQMNTSNNPVPTTDKEAIDNSTLSTDKVYETGPYQKDGTYKPKVEAQEDESQMNQ